jgi:type III secretion protein S
VFATILLTARWLSGELYNFTLSVFDLLYKIR